MRATSTPANPAMAATDKSRARAIVIGVPTMAINRLVDICRGKEVNNPAEGTIGRRAVQVLDAMYRSAESGRMEEV